MALRAEPFAAALRDIADALGRSSIEWAVAGAVAANRYRDETRTTSDLDVLLALADREVSVVRDALEQRGWTTTAIAEGFLLRMHHAQAGRIDLMISGTDYENGAIARAHRVSYGEKMHVKTLAVEDVVILKLIANRWRDHADIESILVARPDFDREYMARRFEEFDLNERFKRIEATAKERRRLSDDHRGGQGSAGP